TPLRIAMTKNTNCCAVPTPASAFAPSRPTMIVSTMPSIVCRRPSRITGQASWKTRHRKDWGWGMSVRTIGGYFIMGPGSTLLEPCKCPTEEPLYGRQDSPRDYRLRRYRALAPHHRVDHAQTAGPAGGSLGDQRSKYDRRGPDFLRQLHPTASAGSTNDAQPGHAVAARPGHGWRRRRDRFGISLLRYDPLLLRGGRTGLRRSPS